MRRATCCLLVFAITFCIGRPTGDAEARTVTKHKPPVRTMFEQLDQIDKSPALSPAKAGELLKVTLEPVPAESNEYLYIFKGHGGFWKEAELRLPRGGDGTKFVLVLELATPVPMKEVTAHYGDTFAMESPNPSAGAHATVGYSYARPLGKLRFSFPSFEEYAARTILFDRM
jgi:hypothetical protein